jgi:hypothetical protein
MRTALILPASSEKRTDGALYHRFWGNGVVEYTPKIPHEKNCYINQLYFNSPVLQYSTPPVGLVTLKLDIFAWCS